MTKIQAGEPMPMITDVNPVYTVKIEADPTALTDVEAAVKAFLELPASQITVFCQKLAEHGLYVNISIQPGRFPMLYGGQEKIG